MSSVSEAYADVTPLLRLNQQPPLTSLSHNLTILVALCLEDEPLQRKYILSDTGAIS